MKKHFKAFGLLLTFVSTILLLQACADLFADTSLDIPPPRTTSVSEEELEEAQPLVTAINDFGLNLMRENGVKSQENLVISPVSVHSALSMTKNGADGETREQMAAVLGVDALAEDEVNESWRTLIDSLRASDPHPASAPRTFTLANAIWYQEDFTLSPLFESSVQDSYDAIVAPLDFVNPRAPRTVNNWISRQTDGLIENVIEEFSADAVMCLVNTVYFQSNWSQPFEQMATRYEDFTRLDGTVVSTPLMHSQKWLGVYQDENFNVANLRYADNKSSLYIFLPHTNEQFDATLVSLSSERIREIRRDLTIAEGAEIEVAIPKIDTEFSSELRTVLIDMGMPDAFDMRSADFSRMFDAESFAAFNEELFISKVLHSTRLIIDEDGTTAAAATVVEVLAGGMPTEPVTEFICDRPFIIALVDDVTGTILFLGAVMDPTQ